MWKRIIKSKRYYENVAIWWEQCVKRKIKSFFKWERYKKNEEIDKKSGNVLQLSQRVLRETNKVQ